MRSAAKLEVEIDAEGAHEIAARARGTPRIANNLLRRVRDFAQVRANNRITRTVADEALTLLEIDPRGLDEMDVRILETLVHKFNGGPVGLNTIAVSVGEEPDTVEEVYEPFLIQEGYLERTPKGRLATAACYARARSHASLPTERAASVGTVARENARPSSRRQAPIGDERPREPFSSRPLEQTAAPVLNQQAVDLCEPLRLVGRAHRRILLVEDAGHHQPRLRTRARPTPQSARRTESEPAREYSPPQYPSVHVDARDRRAQKESTRR